MNKIKVAIVGIGNCASSLVQGIEYYRGKTEGDATGLMYWDIGGYTPADMEIVAAFDVDARKVGKDVAQAIFTAPNCTTVFCENIPATGTTVQMGCLLGGIADHMDEHPEANTFVRSDTPEPSQQDIIGTLKQSGAEVLMSHLPVGSEDAARFYAECALQADVALVNNMPVFIVSDSAWAKRFEEKNIPIIGDDIKAQLGATITHRTLADLDDVTKVHSEHGHIRHIGKQLTQYDAYDTGIFLCTPGLFGALKSSMEQGDDSLSGGVYRLAEKNLAHVHDIEGRFWLDADDETAFHKATAVLQAASNTPGNVVAETATAT